jgi:hypothetical protein
VDVCVCMIERADHTWAPATSIWEAKDSMALSPAQHSTGQKTIRWGGVGEPGGGWVHVANERHTDDCTCSCSLEKHQ